MSATNWARHSMTYRHICHSSTHGILYVMQSRYPALLSNARGVGTFRAVDVRDAAAATAFVTACLSRGLHLGVCGESTVRFRPALIFTEAHLNVAKGIMKAALEEIN